MNCVQFIDKWENQSGNKAISKVLEKQCFIGNLLEKLG